jgi:cytochrome bd-type quinol oxidase subunit 1
MLNFQEYMKNNNSIYKTIIGILMAYLACQIILICVSSYSIINKSTGEFAKYIKKIVNFQLIFNVKVASGPIIAVAVNVFYCQ